MTRQGWRKNRYRLMGTHTHRDAHSHYHSLSYDREMADFQKSVNPQLEGGASAKTEMLEGPLP